MEEENDNEFERSLYSNNHEDFFEMRLPQIKGQEKNKQKPTNQNKKKNYSFLKQKINFQSSSNVQILKSNILETLTKKIKGLQRSIQLKKTYKLISKKLIPFYLENSLSYKKVAFLHITNNFKDCLDLFNINLFERLEFHHIKKYEIKNISDITKCKKQLIEDFDKDKTITQVFISYSDIFDNQAKVNDNLKLVHEEICSCENLTNLKFFLSFQVSENFIFESNKSKFITCHIKFYESQHLFSNFLYEMLKDVNFFPLFETSIFYKMFESFDYCDYSFSEVIRRIKVLIHLFIMSNNDEYSLNLISIFINQNDSKTLSKEILKDKSEIGNDRALITLTLEIFEKIFKKNFNLKKIIKKKILFHLIGKKQLMIPGSAFSPENTNMKELAIQIAKTILDLSTNQTESLTDFANKKFLNIEVLEKFQKKGNHINNKRLSQLTKNIPSEQLKSTSLSKEIEINLVAFLKNFVLDPLEKIQKGYSNMILKKEIFDEAENKINPDILGNIRTAIFDQKAKSNKTNEVLSIFEKFNRKFDINSAYLSFTKDKSEEEMKLEELNVAFLYSLNELQYLGFISSKEKAKLIFSKNIFAKTFFNDYSKKFLP